ncbi:MAG: phytanoyl-CoA dioxygenase family protein [Burkholderiaceae bacterium]
MPSSTLPNQTASVARPLAEAIPSQAAALAGQAYIAGRSVPPELLGALNDVPDWRTVRDELPQMLERDGYVLLRNALPVDQVMNARQDVLERLAAVGEIAQPAEAAVATGTSRREALQPDLNAYWRGVCESPVLRAATHGPALAEISAAVLGGTTKPFDFLWLRTMLEGRASPLHFDHVYMNRGTPNMVTIWVPLGNVSVEGGPLVVVEGSNRFTDLQDRYRGVDVDRDGLPGSFPEDAVAFATNRHTRLLTANFNIGDVIVFDMFTLHGSCDNRMGGGRVRLSCDVRWQRAGEAEDDRWYGSPPKGHGDLSYGGLNGARPLGQPYVAR